MDVMLVGLVTDLPSNVVFIQYGIQLKKFSRKAVSIYIGVLFSRRVAN